MTRATCRRATRIGGVILGAILLLPSIAQHGFLPPPTPALRGHMPLPPAPPRALCHTRHVECRRYRREDGLILREAFPEHYTGD